MFLVWLVGSVVNFARLVKRPLSHSKLPDDARLGPPLRVVVTTARSLLQPMTPDVAKVEPVVLGIGTEIAFEELIERLVSADSE